MVGEAHPTSSVSKLAEKQAIKISLTPTLSQMARGSLLQLV
jgi:hypothetical protein